MGSEHFSLSFIFFIIVIMIMLFIEKKNFKREGIVFLRRSSKGLAFLKKLSKKYGRIINYLGDFAVVLSYGLFSWRYIFKESKNKRYAFCLLAIYFFIAWLVYDHFKFLESAILGIWNSERYSSLIINISRLFGYGLGIGGLAFFLLSIGSFSILYNSLFLLKEVQPPLQIVLPISVPSKYNLPVLSVPFDKWLISVVVLVIVHEFAHAIMSASNNIRVKSVGYGFMLFLPLGFAEPDERQLKKSKLINKLRVYAAGSFSNFIFALIFGLLFIPFNFGLKHMDVYEFQGICYNGLVKWTNAPSVLPVNGTITHIDGVQLHNFTHFAKVLNSYHPGENITLTINGTNYTVTLCESPKNSSLPFIGIMHVGERYEMKEDVKNNLLKKITFYLLLYFGSLFMWISLLNLGIGIANLLPLIPLDGGLMIKEMLERHRAIYLTIFILTFLLLVFSLFGKFIIKIFL